MPFDKMCQKVNFFVRGKFHEAVGRWVKITLLTRTVTAL